MKNPAGMALDATGILWVMDWANARYDAFDPATGTCLHVVHGIAVARGPPAQNLAAE